jgi:hypothetical protein
MVEDVCQSKQFLHRSGLVPITMSLPPKWYHSQLNGHLNTTTACAGVHRGLTNRYKIRFQLPLRKEWISENMHATFMAM